MVLCSISLVCASLGHGHWLAFIVSITLHILLLVRSALKQYNPSMQLCRDEWESSICGCFSHTFSIPRCVLISSLPKLTLKSKQKIEVVLILNHLRFCCCYEKNRFWHKSDFSTQQIATPSLYRTAIQWALQGGLSNNSKFDLVLMSQASLFHKLFIEHLLQ